MKANRIFQITSLLMLAGALNIQAQPVVRADAAGPLNLTTAWTNGVVPGSGNIAQWDSSVATAANCTAALGQDMSWQGINIYNPVAAVVFSLGNTLTLGSSGVNMSAASQNLTLGCPLILGNPQTWTVASGRTLTITNVVSAGANLLTIGGAGATTVSGPAAITSTGGITKTGAGTLTINGANPSVQGISTLTIKGGLINVSSGGAANSLNSSANIVLGGG